MNNSVLTRTVRTFPTDSAYEIGGSTLFLNISTAANRIEPWGKDWVKRDRQLGDFWKREPFLASAIFSIVATRTSFNWELDGPPRTVAQVHDMLQKSEFGSGLSELKKKVALDLLTQDNGAFVEIIRDKKRPGHKPESAPVLSLAHLDASRCVRTGNPKQPVIYVDSDGKLHRLKWYQVMTFEEFPSPSEKDKNRQVSFLSRVLNAAIIVNEINTYNEEKVSGRFTRAMHFIGGVAQHEIEKMQRRAQLDADNTGLTRFMEPVILAALDPNSRISKETVEFASIPDNFEFDELMKWYISLLAMAAGGDYQDFAPLPGGNLGTASQSETLHQKSRIKGHQLWMKLWEHKLQHHRVIPRTVTFRYLQQDAEAELQQAELEHKRAVTRAARISSHEISLEVARQIAVDDGDLKQEYLMMMGEADQTPTIAVTDDELPPNPATFEEEHDGSDQTFGSEPSATGNQNQNGNRTPNNVGRGTPGGRPPKEEEEANANKRVGERVAFRAAWWLKSIIEEHPVQSVSPISEAKLQTFVSWLRNNITREMSLGTDDAWQDRLLIRAAYESGIHPHTLRYRLPDNYRLYIRRTGVKDSNGHVIYSLPIEKKVARVNKARIAPTQNGCFVCGMPRHNHNYVAFHGWRSVCEEHNTFGLRGNETQKQHDLVELQRQFCEQFIEINTVKMRRPLLLSSMLYAYHLGTEKKDLTDTEKQQVTELYNQKAPLLEVLNTPHLFTVILSDLYYRGLKEWYGADTD